MEGYPINGLSSYDNISCSTSTDSIMASMCNVTPGSWVPIITMKEELINHMKEDLTTDDLIDTEEESYLEGTSYLIIKFMQRFNSQLNTMNEAEVTMKNTLIENQKDIDTLTTFVEFLGKVNHKCSQNTDKLEKDIIKISNEIKKNNNMKAVRDTYILEKKKYHKNLNIIRLLNQMNVGSTCSICLQDNVNSYFNPCGHTACSTCCEKNSGISDNCPLCRTYIQGVHKLYFT